MAKSRTQKAMLNTFTSGLSEVVQLICGLILPRMILSTFGSSYNGIASSAKQYLNVVSILTVGIAGSTRVALYRSLADQDNAKTSSIIKATERYMRKVGMVLLAYLIILTIVYPIVIDTGYSWIEVAPIIIAAGISASGRYFFGTAYNALLSADQSTYVNNIFLMVTNIANVLFSMLFIKAGCSVQVVKLVSSTILVLNPALRSLYVRQKYKLDRHCEPDNSALGMRRDVMAHSIANIVHDNTDILVLTVFCNIKIVSVYTVYNLVMHVLKKTQRVFTAGTESVFGNMWVKGELEKIRINLDYFEYIVTAFVSTAFSTTLVMILPFIALYTRGVHDVEYILPMYAIVITVAQIFFAFRSPYITLVQGVGHYKQTKKGAYAEAAINLTTSVILVQFIGITGVAVGTLIANIFRTVQYAFYIDNHIVKRGKLVFAKRILWAMCNIVITCLATYRIAAAYAYRGWVEWIACSVGVGLFSVAVLLISTLVFYRNDLKGVKEMLLRGFGKRKLTART